MQEHLGGRNVLVDAPSDALLRFGESVMQTIAPTPLYARVDVVRDDRCVAERYCLMELELIEPSFYAQLAPDVGRRFREAVDRLMVTRATGIEQE